MAHRKLVERIVSFIETMVSEEFKGVIKADIDGFERPSISFSAYIPDVLFCDNNQLIIGEAKTLGDFGTPHSKSQYEAYCSECLNSSYKTAIIIAIPWELFITAKNHFTHLKKRFGLNADVYILNDAGKVTRV